MDNTNNDIENEDNEIINESDEQEFDFDLYINQIKQGGALPPNDTIQFE